MPSVSQQQQKLFGLALAFKRGEVPSSEVSDEIKAIADRMSEKDIEDFAATKHKGLPKMKEQLRKIVREIMREKAISEINEQSLTEEKYTVIDPKGNQKGVGLKMQAAAMAKKLGGEKTGHFVVANKNALKARRALEKFKGDFKNPKLKDMMADLFYESVNEAASRTAMEIGGLTGLNKDAIQKFVDTHNMDIEKVYQYVKKAKLTDRLNFVTAIVGTPGNSVQKKMIKMFGESINEGKFKVDDLVYNKRTKTVGIVRMGDDKYGEVKTDADGNVSVDELEKYNPIKFKHQTKAKVAPSTEKEVNSRGLFNPFKTESVNEYNVNKKFGSKYDIGAGSMGNGTTFWNRAEEEFGEYKKIAHVADNGKITFYDKALPSNVKKHIEDYAKQK